MMKLIKVLPFVMTLTVMAAIFVFSSQSKAVSSDISEGLTVKIVNTIPVIKDKPTEVKKEIVKDIHSCIRKCAHFVLYALLGISSFLMFMVIKYGSSDFRLWLLAMIFCVIYAISDEIHQLFIPGRSGEIGDILLDLSGAMSGGILFINLKEAVLYFCNRRKQ